MTLIIAHRGHSVRAPENTRASFRAALEVRAPAAECDVRLTRDGHVVLLHDATVDRTTDGEGAVAELSLAQAQGLDAGSWKDARYRGERIPTLAETLAVTKGRMRLVVEIKQEGIASRVVEAIRAADALADVTVISFGLETCRAVRNLEPRIPVGWLTGDIRDDTDSAADALIQAALSAHAQFLNVAHAAVTEALLCRARPAGLSVWAWTVNDPGRVRELARAGVAAITSDDPAMALEAIADTL